mgnify:CR=1 FL=1
MTLRELLHQQIDQLDTQQLTVLESVVGQLARKAPQAPKERGGSPYREARRLLAGRTGFAQSIIEGREDRL